MRLILYFGFLKMKIAHLSSTNLFFQYVSHSGSYCNETPFNDFIYKTIATEIHEISWFSACHLTKSYKIESSRVK